MKKINLLMIMVLGVSSIAFGQTKELKSAHVSSVQQISTTEKEVVIMDNVTGESRGVILPINASVVAGEAIQMGIVKSDGAIYDVLAIVKSDGVIYDNLESAGVPRYIVKSDGVVYD